MAYDPISRGERAAKLLEDDLLADAFQAIEERALGEFRTSKPEEKERREAAYTKLRLLEEFKAELRRVITGGKMVVAQKSRAT
ncbi:hypothetical protein [Azospirillum soli]|uniref:hypothetical protein n=1 Tax=Azospirillum soli TaxID=1304799 RepID=UPI001AE19156|nr:hypothetical protein [Azospirillum soli]MBP2311891.1 hypothetical protein [Azospirillum soli]